MKDPKNIVDFIIMCNMYFSHPENMLSMIPDEDIKVRGWKMVKQSRLLSLKETHQQFKVPATFDIDAKDYV